ncbi:MAG: hypothetical protein IJM39_08085 [Firmicutes bacterium]|nr:hypothetical protein [Bacillota bacterium]
MRRRIISLIIAFIMVLSAAFVAGPKAYALDYGTDTYTRLDDDEAFSYYLGSFQHLMNKAKAVTDPDEQIIAYAKAEAELLDSALVFPMTSQTAGYAMGRIAPHTKSLGLFGYDSSRVTYAVASEDLISVSEREELEQRWKAARSGEGSYDPAAYLVSKGHKLKTELKFSFSTLPSDLDWENNTRASAMDIFANVNDSLVRYDMFGQIVPALAESWMVSGDGLEYTFNLRSDVNWYRSDGTVYAKLTAQDLLDSFEYISSTSSPNYWLFENVAGVSCPNDSTLVIDLYRADQGFLSLLSFFAPVCSSFKAEMGDDYASASDPASQLYCGAFRIASIADDEIVLAKNSGYYDAGKVAVDTVRFILVDGSDPEEAYNKLVSGDLDTLNLNNLTRVLAVNDGNFEKYAYVVPNSPTVYLGTLNVNRGTFALSDGSVASQKTEAQKISTAVALSNKNFRKALLFAFDKASYNAVTTEEDMKYLALRNMLTYPELLHLSKDVAADGQTFKKGSSFGDLVQHYLEAKGSHIDTSDGTDGWFSADAAKAALAKAKAELGQDVSYPVILDIVYVKNNSIQLSRAQAIKDSIETVLGAENVSVCLVEAETSSQYYQCGYMVDSGSEYNMDFYYGSGWGADYADPAMFLNIFTDLGYMTKQLGISPTKAYVDEPVAVEEAADAGGNPLDVEVTESTDPSAQLTEIIASSVIGGDTDPSQLQVLWQKELSVSEGTQFPVTVEFSVENVSEGQPLYVFHFNGSEWELAGKGTAPNITATFTSLSPVAIVAAEAEAPADGIVINAENFPDEVFRSYVSDNFDEDGNGVLSASEIGEVDEIEVSSMGIESIKGVEHFPSLKKLYCSFNTSLEPLDLSSNTGLEILECVNCGVGRLDVSGCTKLRVLNCQFCLLTELDLSKNTDLEYLNCEMNHLKSLDLSKNPALIELNCSFNDEITEIDVSNKAELKVLKLTDCDLASLDISKNTKLITLFCGFNRLTSLDVSKNTALVTLYCYGNSLGDLDVSHNTELKELMCNGIKLSTLDLSNNTKLEYLYCVDNPGLKVLDISKCPKLIKAYTEGKKNEMVDEGFVTVSYTYENDDAYYYLHVDGAVNIITETVNVATVTGISLDLQDKISVQFKIQPDDNVAYAELSVQKPNGSFDTPVKVVLNKADTSVYKAAEDKFVVRYSEITTKMISQGVKLTVYDKSGNAMDIYRTTNDKTYTQADPLVYSAADWCKAAIAHYGPDKTQKTAWLAMAVLNLGGEAQKYFEDYNPGNPANPNGYLADDMAAFKKNAAYDQYISDANAKKKGYSGMTLDLAADTRLRVKFTDNVAVTVDDKAGTLIKEGDKYVLDITGLRCIDLDQFFKVGFKGTDGSEITMDMCALSWCNAAMDKLASEPKNQTLRLAKAVNIYSEAAEYYFK